MTRNMKGIEIKAAVVASGMSQAELARKIGYNEAHVSRTLSSEWSVSDSFQLEVSRVLDTVPAPSSPKTRYDVRYLLQREVRDYLNSVLFETKSTWFPIPNEYKQSNGKFYAMGIKHGIPDLCVLFNERAFFIELKGETHLLTMDQRERHVLIKCSGCPVAVCRSLDEVRQALTEWGIPLRELETERLLRESER